MFDLIKSLIRAHFYNHVLAFLEILTAVNTTVRSLVILKHFTYSEPFLQKHVDQRIMVISLLLLLGFHSSLFNALLFYNNYNLNDDEFS